MDAENGRIVDPGVKVGFEVQLPARSARRDAIPLHISLELAHREPHVVGSFGQAEVWGVDRLAHRLSSCSVVQSRQPGRPHLVTAGPALGSTVCVILHPSSVAPGLLSVAGSRFPGRQGRLNPAGGDGARQVLRACPATLDGLHGGRATRSITKPRPIRGEALKTPTKHGFAGTIDARRLDSNQHCMRPIRPYVRLTIRAILLR